jgi:hypothetical protein
MDQADLERLRQKFDSEVRGRFPDVAIERIEVLQYGEEAAIEPGELLARVILDGSSVTGTGEEADEERGRLLEDFHAAHRDAIRALRGDLSKMPGSIVLEIFVGGGSQDPHRSPRMRLAHRKPPLGATPGEGSLTPVMARLGPEDLETLDTLITAGIAPSRAEAVRWALARIRERPAYEQLRARAREIEELKTQF